MGALLVSQVTRPQFAMPAYATQASAAAPLASSCEGTCESGCTVNEMDDAVECAMSPGRAPQSGVMLAWDTMAVLMAGKSPINP